MRINFRGQLVDEPEIRAGFIGCGSHSSRNIYPALQFAPVKLIATCDLSIEKARAFAVKYGAERAYSDYQEMLRDEELDAVFIVTGYDASGKPLYPDLAVKGTLEQAWQVTRVFETFAKGPYQVIGL